MSLFLFLIFSLYINKDVYYISRWGMYIKIENNKSWKTDTTIVYLSDSRWNWGDNYIKYHPYSAEISNLGLHLIKDTLYTIEEDMKIVEIQLKDYKYKIVHFIRDYERFDYWTDSTFIKEDSEDWISINHRHGIYKSWKEPWNHLIP